VPSNPLIDSVGYVISMPFEDDKNCQVKLAYVVYVLSVISFLSIVLNVFIDKYVL